MEPVPVGSLQLRGPDEPVPFEQALRASNCITDDGTIRGREAYRAVVASAAAVGSGVVQAVCRYRTSPTSAKVVVVAGGSVYTVSDPGSEVLSNGVVTSLGAISGWDAGTPAGSSVRVAAAQLGKYVYLCADDGSAAYRLDSAGTLTSMQEIAAIKQIAKLSFETLAWTAFSTITPTVVNCVLQTNANTGMSGLGTYWRAFTATNNGNDACPVGATASFKLAAAKDATGYDWLAITISPQTEPGSAGTRRIAISVGTDTAGSPTDLTNIGEVYDVPGVGGSPNLVYCSLLGLPAAVRSAIRWIRFEVTGASGGKFAVYGWMFLASRAPISPQRYYATVRDSSTQQESSAGVYADIAVRDGDIDPQSYPNVWNDDGNFKGAGTETLFNPQHNRIWNRESGLAAYPSSKSAIGLITTIRVTFPDERVVGVPPYSPGQEVRVWKDTQNGRRLVGAAHVITAGDIAAGYYDFVDNGGNTTLSNEAFHAGGVLGAANALAARGGRLVSGYENRVSVSSYTPPGETRDPYPQWPALAIWQSDGWQFDLSPTKAEQITGVVNGDGMYVLTNEAVYVLQDLTPDMSGRPPSWFSVSRQGCLGRRAYAYVPSADSTGVLVWASPQGVWVARGRASAVCLSEPITELYQNQFLPDSTVVVAYRKQKLFVFCGSRYLRFDFVSSRWTSGTLSHNIVAAACWTDPGSPYEQMWVFTDTGVPARWQETAVRDLQVGGDDTTGVAIPAWAYSTGYAAPGFSTRVKRLYLLLAGGSVQATVAKDDAGTASRTIGFPDTADKPVMGDLASLEWRLELAGSYGTRVRRIQMDLTPEDKLGT